MRDLNELSYDDWVDFVFNHPVTPVASAWHFEPEWEYVCVPEKLIDNMTELFRNAGSLASKYSVEQLEQGFWFMPGPNGFVWAILSPDVSLEKRCACIDGIVFLFEDLFCKNSSLATVSYMWWDSVFSYCALGDIDLGNDFDVLERVALAISRSMNTGCEASKRSAMHGLGHIIEIYKSTGTADVKHIIASNFGDAALDGH